MKTYGKSSLAVVLIALAVSGFLAISGCSDDDPVKVNEVSSIGAQSPDELVSYFLAAYGGMDFPGYQSILDSEFLMILSDATISEYPGLGTTINYSEEERIHERMFSGDNVTDPNGYLILGVSAITFNVFNLMGAWAATDNEEMFPNTVWAPYQVDLRIDRSQSYSSRTDGLVKIYARSHEVTVNGKVETYFLLAGMVDLTGLYKGSESTTWGIIKGMYR